MNAGGVSKACKSNGSYAITSSKISGKRVRNTLITYLEVVKNSGKLELIHDGQRVPKGFLCKDFSPREGSRPYQLVGEVMAHQGYDG